MTTAARIAAKRDNRTQASNTTKEVKAICAELAVKVSTLSTLQMTVISGVPSAVDQAKSTVLAAGFCLFSDDTHSILVNRP